MTPNQLKRQRLSRLRSVSDGYLDSITATDIHNATRDLEAARAATWNGLNRALNNQAAYSEWWRTEHCN